MAQSPKLPEVVSAVTVTEPVDGRKRRRSSAYTSTGRGSFYALQLDPVVMSAARRALRKGERIRVVDAYTVRLVPAPHE